MAKQDERLYPLSAAGREIGYSIDWLRALCDRGDVEHVRDISGRRLIPEHEVRRLQEERERTRDAAALAGGRRG